MDNRKSIVSDAPCKDALPKRYHKAYDFLEGWIYPYELHEPTRYSQVTKDFIYSPVMRGLIKNAIQETHDVMKESVFKIIAYAVVHDRKHLAEIENNVSDKKCIILTEYPDIAELLSSRIINGAIDCYKTKGYEIIKDVVCGNVNKPLIMCYGKYRIFCQDYLPHLGLNLLEYPEVHVVDLPIDSDLHIFSKKTHIYPVMGNVYSYMLRINFHAHPIRMDLIESSLLSIIDTIPGADCFDSVSESITFLLRDFKHFYDESWNDELKIKSEKDLEVRDFLTKRFHDKANLLFERKNKLEKECKNIELSPYCKKRLKEMATLQAECLARVDAVRKINVKDSRDGYFN